MATSSPDTDTCDLEQIGMGCWYMGEVEEASAAKPAKLASL